MTTFRKLLAALLLTVTPVAAVAATQTPASAYLTNCHYGQGNWSGQGWAQCLGQANNGGYNLVRAEIYCTDGTVRFDKSWWGRTQISWASCPPGVAGFYWTYQLA